MSPSWSSKASRTELRRRGAAGLALGLCTAAALLAGPPSGALADQASLYRGAPPRPGPDILYASPPRATQLENRGIWRAEPILVSGASAYRDGEFLYQDFIYDDHGARSGVRDPEDPRTAHEATFDLFSQPNGTYTYPDDPVYADNAADLVELRIRPTESGTAFRVTLNTLHDPELVGFTIALGSSAKPREFPFGANVRAPAQLFLTVHGRTAELRPADGGRPLAPAPRVAVDELRRQFTVTVPRAAWDPERRVVRVAAGVGLWDPRANRYLVPQPSRDAEHPGGAGTLSKPAAFFNAAFRHAEPLPEPSDLERDTVNAAWWRDKAQGAALRKGTLAPFHALVDFDKLRRGIDDEMSGEPRGVPRFGPMDRIFASRFETQQGIEWDGFCGAPIYCQGELRGQLQPYAVYVPREPPPPRGYGLTLLGHSLTASYNQYLGSRNQSQFGERGPGSIVLTPEGRGPDVWYWGVAGADVFEAWADVARHYDLDPGWTAISGYSMGGYMSFKLGGQYPDLFAKAQPTTGAQAIGIWSPPADPIPYPPNDPATDETPSNTYSLLPSFRNIPILMWTMGEDELVPYTGSQAFANRLDELGYRYSFENFHPGEHLMLAFNDEYGPAADWLGTTRVNRNPAHVTYAVNPRMNFRASGTVGDHAYWLSEVRVRDLSGSAPHGTIDVYSHGFGAADRQPGPTEFGGGVLTGGKIAPLAFTRQSRHWGGRPPATPRNRLDVVASNVRHVAIWTRRARVGCRPLLDVRTDGPLEVELADCPKTSKVSVGAGTQLLRPKRR